MYPSGLDPSPEVVATPSGHTNGRITIDQQANGYTKPSNVNGVRGQQSRDNTPYQKGRYQSAPTNHTQRGEVKIPIEGQAVVILELIIRTLEITIMNKRYNTKGVLPHVFMTMKLPVPTLIGIITFQ